MNSKIATLILALAFGGTLRAEDSPAGHDHSATPAKEAPAKPAPKPKKCQAHNAAKSDCFICNPALRDKGRLWCKEHSRYEDRCFLCHPEIEESGRAYCGKHPATPKKG